MVPENKDAVVEKIIQLEKYLSELGEFRDITFYRYQRNTIVRRGVERLLQLLVEVAGDINGVLLMERDQRPPTSYFDSFIKAGDAGIIGKKLAREIAPAAGLRNRLVHEYGEYKDEIVFKNITRFLRLYDDYLKDIKSFVKKLPRD